LSYVNGSHDFSPVSREVGGAKAQLQANIDNNWVRYCWRIHDLTSPPAPLLQGEGSRSPMVTKLEYQEILELSSFIVTKKE